MVTVNNALPGINTDREQFDRSAVLGLVADVGGTHIRFGIAVDSSAGSANPGALDVHCVRRYAVRAHESIAHAAQHYRSDTPGVPADLDRAAVAVAGRVDHDLVQLTNSAWSFSARALSESQQFQHLHELAEDKHFLALSEQRFKQFEKGFGLAGRAFTAD